MSQLEKQIEEAAAQFALQVVEVIKNATLQELIALQDPQGGTSQSKKRGRKPGPKAKAAAPTKKKVDGRKNRVVKNYPKCAYPKCNNNRFPRGQGFCGEHWRQWQEGKIKSAAEYAKKN
jgi:hypothetical protein